MALVALTYTPVVTGADMDSFIKAAAQGKDPKQQGLESWKAILTRLYTDFNTILKTALIAYLQQSNVIFVPGIPSPIVYPPVELSEFQSKISSSASYIDSNVKSESTGKPPTEVGKIVWKVVYTKIFEDINNVISKAVCNACNSSTTLVPVGVIAPPHVGTVAPVPATKISPFSEAELLSLLQGTLNIGTATSLGIDTDSTIKGSCQSVPPPAQGPKVWQIFIDKLSQKIKPDLEKHIKIFLSSKPRWGVTIGAPGTNPAGVPPILPTASPLPGNII